MKTLAETGDVGRKMWHELALDYHLIPGSKGDLLSRLGSRSKHNRLIYMVCTVPGCKQHGQPKNSRDRLPTAGTNSTQQPTTHR
jgi:hypothetical protein